MDLNAAHASLAEQDGVVSRRQLLARGLDDNDIERLLRRRELTAVHQGAYVEHTGPLTWRQRAWAAVLDCWPAALYGRSAMDVAQPSSRRRAPFPADELIHVAIEHPRKKLPPPGVRVHRVVGLAEKVQWNLGAPRMRAEEAVLAMCAEERSPDRALAVAADACQQRRTTPARLLTALTGRRIRHGGWLRSVFEDIASGDMCSTPAAGPPERIDRILRRRGWEGRIHPCGPDCSALSGRLPASDAGQRPA